MLENWYVPNKTQRFMALKTEINGPKNQRYMCLKSENFGPLNRDPWPPK